MSSSNGRFPDDRDSLDFIGFEWDEVENLAAELGVEIVRVTTGGAANGLAAPQRVVRQVRRGDVLELTLAAEAWTL